jgi:phage repressor protein C with HTH and peptisase S24 domain
MSANAKPQRSWLQLEVSGESMFPTLRPGDFVIGLRTSKFQPGQVVLLEDSNFRLVIKRLTKLEGANCWVEGDNPAQSIDSRQYGPISPTQLKAVIKFRYWPWPKLVK